MRKIKLCIVTEFEQENFFQWEMVLNWHSKLEISSAVMNKNVLMGYPLNNELWNSIREADIVFVYCARHDLSWEWYKLPLLVKKIMNPEAKMICQFDLEFLWLFYPNHHFWKKEVVWVKDRTPEQFFKETKVMEVADVYIILFNALLKKYTSKPTYYLPLPQLVRYDSFLKTTPSKKSLRNKSKRTVLLRHSVKSASIEGTLKKVIISSGIPVTIFTTDNTDSKGKFKILETLPQPRKSVVYGNVSRDSYMEFLERGYMAIDDNEGYYGWSRFAMECALTHVPCVGSTYAVKEFFPELYTKSKDYKKQRELLRKLCNDSNFWLRMAKTGKRLVLKKMDTDYLIKELVKIITSVVKQTAKTKTARESKVKPVKSNTSELLERKKYREFVEKHKLRHKTIPPRPPEDSSVMDSIHKRIITQREWDIYYGKWREFIDGKKTSPLLPFKEEIIERKTEQKKAEMKIALKPEKKITEKRTTKPRKPVGIYVPSEPTIATRFTKHENVSIIIPTFNQKDDLIKTLRLLQLQIQEGDEIIIVDDGSTDGTKDAVRKCKFPNVTLLCQEHKGHSHAVKLGVMSVKTSHACGNVVLVEPDDDITSNFVHEIMKGLWSRSGEGRQISLDKPRTMGFYASYAHPSNIAPLAEYLRLSKIYNVVRSPPWYNRKKKVRGEFPKADVYVTCSSSHRKYLMFDIPNTIWVMHGLSPAEIECLPAHKIHEFKGCLLSGSWFLKQIKRKDIWKTDIDGKRQYGNWYDEHKEYQDNFFKIVGWMKGDILFSPRINEIVDEIIEKCNIKLPYEKTILYTPTGFWKIGYGCFAETIDPLIDAANYLKMNLIIKLHFGTIKYEPCKTAYRRAKEKTINMKNITWIESDELEDVTPLFKISDVLVSDASSTLIEFLQVNKPSIEMMNRNSSIEKRMEDWMGFSMPSGITIKCWKSKNLRKLLARAVYYPEEHEKERLKWQKEFFYKVDGRATERSLKAIEEIMGWSKDGET